MDIQPLGFKMLDSRVKRVADIINVVVKIFEYLKSLTKYVPLVNSEDVGEFKFYDNVGRESQDNRFILLSEMVYQNMRFLFEPCHAVRLPFVQVAK